MDIDKLEAGRELDALVAEQHFGWQWALFEQAFTEAATRTLVLPNSSMLERPASGKEQRSKHYHCRVPHYSTDDAPAWEVVDKLLDEGYCPALLYDDNGHWALSLEGMQNVPIGPDPQDIATSFFINADMWCDTRPLAICRAVLEVLED